MNPHSVERRLEIHRSLIGDNSDAYIIAEIGHNHQGKLDIAMEMFRTAKDCGADAVKLQKRDNKTLFTKAAYNAAYHSENAYAPTYGAHREALEFGHAEFLALRDYAKELGVDFIATAFDMPSADFLAEVGITAIKIASGDIINTPLLKYVASLGKPMIMSTGGVQLEDVQRAYDAVRPLNSQFCILQCTSVYPAEPEHMNLRVINTFRKLFPDIVIGLSDHQNGIAMAVAAYTLGARVFEKHFTLNRAWKGTDHAFSLEPVGLRKLVRDLKRCREALGDGIKYPMAVEKGPFTKMSKKIVAGRDLPEGTVLTMQDLAFKCPGDGLPPYEVDRLLGKRLATSLTEDDPLSFDDVE